MHSNSFKNWFLSVSVSLVSAGCGVEFDSIGQLQGLRVLGIQADPPIAQPGDTVNMQLVVHDTGDIEGEPRAVNYLWLGGCDNPPGDSYFGCLATFGEVAGSLDGLMSADPSQLTPDQLAEIAEALAETGVSLGFGETFELGISPDIIRAKPPNPVPAKVPYALSYTFFAACAGELRPDPDSDRFPVGCFDGETRLGPRDFVAGYTSTYTYEDQRNSLPEILGMRVGGRDVAGNLVCVGPECETLEPDPGRRCPRGAPEVSRCKSGTLRQSCPKVELAVRVDPDSVDQDAPLALGGETAPEPMWVNYHTDHGSFSNDVALVNDVTAGFRDNPKTDFFAPETPGPAFVWAVVRDGRGGFEWARTTICVK